MTRRPSVEFWRGKRIFLTGHSGFKGAWASLWLSQLGAKVYGYALKPQTEPSLHDLHGDSSAGCAQFADLLNTTNLRDALSAADPEIILHLAAQPLVRKSYAEPLATFATNTMGTANLLEVARDLENLKAALIVTTDKVYRNDETGRHFEEGDTLGGHDPYSGSKAAAEIVTATYRTSFFEPNGIKIATARGGNVIGGGDFSEDRLIPDIIRAHIAGSALEIRSPQATRPWQHVLDCLNGYLVYCEDLYLGRDIPTALNFGPSIDEGQISVAAVADTILAHFDENNRWIDTSDNHHLREMRTLGLNPSAANKALGWHSQLKQAEALAWTATWYRGWLDGQDARKLSLEQITSFMKGI